MLRGLFSAVSGMISMAQAQEVICNNIANVATPGFKRDIPVYRSFSTILEREIQNRERQCRIESTFIDFKQGKIESTGRPLDIAIKGEGFFVVLTPYGTAYTRAGSFRLDKEGRLVTPEGYFLLGTKRPLIYIPSDKASKLKISSQGEILVDGKVIDKIRIDVPKKPVFYLYKEGKNLFRVGHTGYAPLKKGNYFVKQGYLELSNVDIVEEMVDLITNFRLYEAAQKAVKIQDATLEKICNQLV